MANNTKRRRETLKRQAFFLGIQFPGEFPSDNDIRSAIQKKSGHTKFSDFLSEQKRRREYVEFCDTDKKVVRPKRMQNVAGSAKEKVQGAAGTGSRMTQDGMGDTGTRATRGRQDGKISVFMILCVLLASLWGISSLEDVMDSKESNKAFKAEVVDLIEELEVANLALDIERLKVMDLKATCLGIPKEGA